MGRGDNRKSLKARQRKAWRRLKLRLRKKIDAAKASSTKAPAKKK